MIIPLVRRTLSVGILFGLTGCALQTATLTGYQDLPSTLNFNVTDLRPESDKTQHALSMLATDCNYGIWRLADTKSNPSRMALLKRDLEVNLGEKLRDKTMVVTEYRMYVNIRGPNNDPMAGTGGGLVGAIMESSHNHCTKEKTPEGWFDNTSPAAGGAYIIAIHATINSKDIEVNSVYEFPLAKYQDSELVFGALRKANSALADQISKNVSVR